MTPGSRSFQFSERRNALAFWVGSLVVSIGVVLHLPMFWMARNHGFNMSGMPMDHGMLLGMFLIVLGILAAGYGLLPIRRTDVNTYHSFAPLALLIVGSSGMISILLPYAAENYPIRVRGRATGWVAGWSKIGGLIAQALSALALVPALGIAAAVISIPAALSMALIWIYGRETRGRDLRELESSAGVPADVLQ